MDKRLLSKIIQEKLKKAYDENKNIELSSTEAGFLFYYIRIIKEQEQETFYKYINAKLGLKEDE